jgi:hypothetical protein
LLPNCLLFWSVWFIVWSSILISFVRHGREKFKLHKHQEEEEKNICSNFIRFSSSYQIHRWKFIASKFTEAYRRQARLLQGAVGMPDLHYAQD